MSYYRAVLIMPTPPQKKTKLTVSTAAANTVAADIYYWCTYLSRHPALS